MTEDLPHAASSLVTAVSHPGDGGPAGHLVC
jgi:hypothetical protein